MVHSAISKARLTFIRSLRYKKHRDRERCFLVEGEKGVGELIDSRFDVRFIACTESYLETHGKRLAPVMSKVFVATEEQLSRSGSLQSNRCAIAVAVQKPNPIVAVSQHEFALVLDDIRDPGNLGTIIRTADWFGIRQIIASEHTVELYNPKVINATMGSFTRVRFGYASLVDYLAAVSLPVYGMFPDREPMCDTRFGRGGFIVVGNESRGISAAVAGRISHPVSIPRKGNAESLNAGIAVGIVLYELTKKTR